MPVEVAEVLDCTTLSIISAPMSIDHETLALSGPSAEIFSFSLVFDSQ